MSDIECEFTRTFIVPTEPTGFGNNTTMESEWVKNGYQNIMSHCKRCGQRALYNNHGDLVFSAFCPRCGARMKNYLQDSR